MVKKLISEAGDKNFDDLASQELINKTTLIIKNINQGQSKDEVEDYFHYILRKFQHHLKEAKKEEAKKLGKKKVKPIGDQAVHVPADYNKV